MRTHVLLATLVLSGAPGAVPGTVPGNQDVPPNGESWALLQGLAAARRIDLVVPVGPCEAAAAGLAARLGADGRFEVSSDPAERDPAALRVLVGTPAEAELASLAQRLGVEPLATGFGLLGREFLAAGDALIAVLEDPDEAGRPLCLVLGNDPDLLSVHLDGLPRLTRPHLWVHADGELALECPLELDGTPRAAEAIDYRARRAEYFAAPLLQEFGGLSVHGHGELERERWKSYGLALGSARKRTLAWLGTAEAEVPKVEVFLYAHHEDFERCLGTSALAVVNRLRPRVHVLLARGLPDDGGAGLARALARALAGAPAAPWLEDGLAVAAAGRWWGRPLDEWLAHLARAKLLPAPDGLFTAEDEARVSPHVLLPARALLFSELVRVSEAEPRKVRALWKGAGSEPRTVGALYRRGAQAALKPVPGQRTAALLAASERETPYRHGLALVESERARYGGRALEQALDEACALAPGPDAVSLTVFGTAEDPRAPLVEPHPQPAHGSSSDAALASALAGARARGLAGLLSLEVLAHPNGAWADVVSWTGAGDVELFFERYGRVALHYALLAELLEVELFSFGSNLRESTRTEGEEERRDPERLEIRRKGWQALLTRLRAAYLGDLTYAARFPGEALEIGFYERLDFLGLIFYPPATRVPGTPAPEVVRRALRYELEQAFDLAVRWNRPLLLLQTGFPARADSWERPHTPRGVLDLAAQQSYLEILAEALAGKYENGAVLRGFFLWNWPLDPARAGPEDAGFSLRGKPAAATLPRFFAR